jgi:hypothetical protein
MTDAGKVTQGTCCWPSRSPRLSAKPIIDMVLAADQAMRRLTVKPIQEEGYTLTANRRGLLAGEEDIEEDINVPELI